MRPDPQPARNRRRKSFRATPEPLEGRQLLSASADLDQQLEAGEQGLAQVLQDNQIALDSVNYTYQGINSSADQQALQQQSNGVAAAAAGGDRWSQAWTAVLTARSLLEQAYALYESDVSSDWYQVQQQAKAVEGQPFVGEAFQLIADDEADPTWTPPSGPTTTAQNPSPTPPPFQLGIDQDAHPDPDGNITLQGGTVVHVDPGGGPPDEAGVDWPGWYYKKLLPMVKSQVFQRDVDSFPGVTEPLSVTLTYEIYKDGHTVSQITGYLKDGRNQVSRNEGIWAQNAKNLMNEFNLPLPQGTTKPSLIRTFTFSYNTGDPAEIKAGPPSEAAATDPNFHLGPKAGIHFGPVHNGNERVNSRPTRPARGGAHHAHH